MKKFIIGFIALSATLSLARADYVFDQTTAKPTGGGLMISRKWTNLSTAFSLGLWGQEHNG